MGFLIVWLRQACSLVWSSVLWRSLTPSNPLTSYPFALTLYHLYCCSHISPSLSNLDSIPDIYSAWAKDLKKKQQTFGKTWVTVTFFWFWYRRTWCPGSTYPTAGQGLRHQSFPNTANRKHHPQQNTYRTGAGFQLQRICACILLLKLTHSNGCYH